ncbi:MAG: RCC1 domain-containing protein [Armatimonadota bacterium]
MFKRIVFVALALAAFIYPASLNAAGVIVGWGRNNFGQCNAPSPNTGFVAVAAGEYHSLGLKSDGSIAAWGNNGNGQCDIPSPNTGFVAVAAGGYHSLGLKSDGSIVAWGYNYYGQCSVPSPNTGFAEIAAGTWHSLGLKSDGSIVAWGYNGNGQCDIPSPNTGFVAVAAGADHSLGLKLDGSIVAWGYNGDGQSNVPSPNTGFAEIAAGTWHSLGLKSDGSIVAWGYNGNGQCDIPSPNTGFVAVAAGAYHNLGLKSDGSIVAWGGCGYGQCSIPSPNTGFVAVAADIWHSLGIRGTEGAAPAPITLTLLPNTVQIGQPLTVNAHAPGATSVRLRCEGIAGGFPELSMTRLGASTFTLSFPTSFLAFARGSTVTFTAYGTSSGGVASSGSAVLRIKNAPNQPISQIGLNCNDANTFGLAESWYEPFVDTTERLETKLLVKQDLNLWFSVYGSASGGATCNKSNGASIAELLGSFGVVNPKGTTAFTGVFTDVNQSATMRLAFDGRAGVMTILEIVLNAVPGGSGVSPASIAAFYPEFHSIAAIYNAGKAFNPKPTSTWGWTKAAGNAAWSLRKLATDTQQRAALRIALSHIGVAVSEATLKDVFTALSIYDVLKIIGSEITYVIQTKGDDLTSTFTSYRTASGSLAAAESTPAAATLYKTGDTRLASESTTLSVAASVSASNQDWLISYSVTNNGASPLWSWTLYYNKASGYPSQVTSPEGWSYRLDYDQGSITWFTQASENGWVLGNFGLNTIPAGGSLAGFSICHSAPPGYTMCSSVDATYASSYSETLAPGGTGSVSETKLRLDLLPKVVSDRVVSAVLPDRFYVADPDRNCGICITGSTTQVVEGDVVRVTGSEVELNGEVAIQASSVLVTSHGNAPTPLGMPLLSIGGSDFGTQHGISNASGLSNVGLFVRTWGKFTYIDSHTFTINDGSGVDVKCVVPDGVTLQSDWRYVVVTGISSCENVGEELHRLLRVRMQSDITAY